jgi:regulator of protease activity HflC (stomatin/prohibitin superfamily)
MKERKTRPVISFFGFYTINQDETGVKLTLGNFSGHVRPGLGFMIPIIQTVLKTKASIQTIDLPDQKIVLNGNISVKISGSVNYKVSNSKRAILEVDNYEYSLKQLAMTTISDVLGTKTIEEVRGRKQQIAQEIEDIIATTSSKWGLTDVDIRLTDAEMDDSLLRAMMRETEAEKEANAILIKAKSDKAVAQTFAEAAEILSHSPGAMTLRILQTLSDMSNSKSTVVVPIPTDFLSAIGMGGGQMALAGVPQEVETAATEAPPSLPSSVDPYKNEAGIYKANCPYCSERYTVDKVVNNYKFDQDPNTPGIQLTCKKCFKLFTLNDI